MCDTIMSCTRKRNYNNNKRNEKKEKHKSEKRVIKKRGLGMCAEGRRLTDYHKSNVYMNLVNLALEVLPLLD